jgi:hypothetical protein
VGGAERRRPSQHPKHELGILDLTVGLTHMMSLIMSFFMKHGMLLSFLLLLLFWLL